MDGLKWRSKWLRRSLRSPLRKLARSKKLGGECGDSPFIQEGKMYFFRDLFSWCSRKDDEWILAVLEDNRGEFTDDFRKWLPNNLHIFGEFCSRSRALKKAGVKHYGAKAIVEIVRYHTALREKGDEAFKVNNNHTAYLARLCMLIYPELEGFFDLRTLHKIYSNKGEVNG